MIVELDDKAVGARWAEEHLCCLDQLREAEPDVDLLILDVNERMSS